MKNKFVVSGNCFHEHYGAEKIKFQATTNLLIFQSGVIARAEDEQQLASVVAHTLGHYYRAHAHSVLPALGYLLEEQEADEIALELMTAAGLDPGKSVTTYLTLLKDNGSYAIGGYDYQKCMDLYLNQWKDRNGVDVMGPVGPWSDLHLSPCFRAYGLSKELEARQMPPPSRSSLLLSNNQWQELKREAAKWALEAKEAGAPISGGLRGCAFSFKGN